jgi:hypothetical protein
MCVLILLYMCPDTSIHVCSGVPYNAFQAELCCSSVAALLYMCPDTSIHVCSGVPYNAFQAELCCSSVAALLYMCPDTRIHVCSGVPYNAFLGAPSGGPTKCTDTWGERLGPDSAVVKINPDDWITYTHDDYKRQEVYFFIFLWSAMPRNVEVWLVQCRGMERFS